MNLPWHHLVAYAHRCMFLHVIARSEATWQSVFPAAVQNKKQYFGRIRKSAYEFARSSTKLPGFPAGTRIAAPVCALVRNDMLKTGRCARVQGRLARGHAETWQVCAGQGRNDMLKTGKCSRLQGRFPAAPPGKRRHAANFWMSLRGAKRRGNPFSSQ